MLGKTVSHYTILDKLGRGGMGEVYRAEDTTLDRQVALKFLPEKYTADREWLDRFEREAKLLASLNHPNIGAIYGLEKAGDFRFLALELVEGETLAERVARGPLPLEEALKICRQIARGLESAHEKGIVHRDLKPANVKITPEGVVKVLDFGLAKSFRSGGPATTEDISDSPTLGYQVTTAGMILGTAAFMSPEQARARPVDRRTDIWAFGCVLYQLLTGREGFSGETVTDIIGAIVLKDPDWTALPAETPWLIKRLLRRCLEKDPDLRIHDISDVRIEIEEVLSGAAPEPPRPIGPAAPPRWKRLLPWGLVLLLFLVALSSLLRPALEPPLVRRLSMTTERIGLIGPGSVAVSPDGKRLVYVGGESQQLYLRALDQLEPDPFSGTEDAWVPFFSPDSQWLGFWDLQERKLKKVPVTGGTPMTLCETENPYGASWGPDDFIYFCAEKPGERGDPVLLRVSATGGRPEVVTVQDDPEEQPGYFAWPEVLPGGETLLVTRFVSSATTLDEGRVEVVWLEDGRRKTVLRGVAAAHYATSGHIVAAWSGGLVAVPFDLEQMETTGPQVPVLEGLRVEQDLWPHFALSRDGLLAYLPGAAGQLRNELLWVDRRCRSEELMEARRFFLEFSVSPGSDQLALTIREKGTDNIWVYDLERGTLTPVTFEGRNAWPRWTPDGRRLIFNSNRNGPYNIFWKPLDGSGPLEQLTKSDNYQTPFSVSPDARVLAFTERHPQTRLDIWMLPFDDTGQPEVFLQTPFNEDQPVFSPDGRWVAYQSDQSRRNQVYVRPYPGPGGAVQISTGGGAYPVWHPNGKELFYLDDERLMSVQIKTQPGFEAGIPDVVCRLDVWDGHYDLAPGGERFALVRREEEEAVTKINVVLNWFEELNRLAPTRR